MLLNKKSNRKENFNIQDLIFSFLNSSSHKNVHFQIMYFVSANNGFNFLFIALDAIEFPELIVLFYS